MISVIALIFLWGFSKRITEQGQGGQSGQRGLGSQERVRSQFRVGKRKTRSQTDLMPPARNSLQALPTTIYEVGTTDLRLDSS